MTKSIAAAGALFLLASCDVKDPIYNTSHPGHAMVTLTTEWSAIGEGLEMPPGYSVEAVRSGSAAPSYTADLTGVTNKLDHLFEPGDYRFYVYNASECVTVRGTVASVIAEQVTPQNADARPADAPRSIVFEWPDWFFTCALDATLAADTEHTLTAPMQQQMRELTIVLELTGGSVERIESISGTLTGVAGTFDMADGTHGAPSEVPLWFEKTEGSDGVKWAASVRLLGIVGATQEIKAAVIFQDNNPSLLPVFRDLTAKLAGFNDDKRRPLSLNITAETPDKPDFSGTIDDWEIGGGGPIVAD